MVRYLPRMIVRLLGLLAISATVLSPLASLPVQADTPANPVTDLVEQWTVGNGLLYWASTCFADEFNSLAVLKRKPGSGGPEQTIESIDDTARCNTFSNLHSSSDGLYYVDSAQSRIARMPLGAPFTAQTVKTLTSAQVPSSRFAEANGYLYWSQFGGTILRTRKDGTSGIETVATTGPSPTDVMVVGSTVYWSDSTGIWTTSVSCATLPCAKGLFSNIGPNARPYGLLYQPLGGFQGSYRVYWVERVESGQNNEFQIRYRACGALAICFVLPPEGQVADPPPSFYSGTTNWFIGNLVLANNNLYWTEADRGTITNGNGDVKRKASNATTPGADTIATSQANISNQLFATNNTLFYARLGSGGIYTLPLNASAIVREFKAEGLEVTQGIQNLANSTPLVAKKTTYVRAYARQLSGPSTPNVQARLVGLLNGLALPGSPLQPINGVRALTTGGGFDRSLLNDGWYFLLPANWTAAGNITLRFEVDPQQIHNDPNRTDNQISQAVTFQTVPPVCVWTVPVRTHTPKPSTTDPNFWTMIDHFKRRWPTPDVWVFRDTDPVEELEFCSYYGVPYPCHGPYELQDGWGIGGPPDRDKVLISLWTRALLSFNPDSCDDIGAPVHFMGMVHPEANNGGASGYASTVSNQSWVQLPKHTPNPVPSGWDKLREGSVMAQELAHNYGRRHVNCGNPGDIDSNYPYPPCQIAPTGPTSYYGFDVTTLQPIKPDQTSDFMSYGNRTWVSDYTWRALLSSIKNSAAVASEATVAAAGDSVFVTGLVDADNQRGEISVVLVLPTGTLPPTTLQTLRAQRSGAAQVGPLATAYTLRLLGPGGTVILERPVTLTSLDDHSEGAAALFSDLFPQPAGQVTAIQLVAGGTVVDSVTPGTGQPTVALEQPAAGTVVDNNLTITWTASDPDRADRLLSTVQYSHDSGASWHTLALNVPSTPSASNTLNFDDLGGLHGSGPNTALIRVLASDGYNTAIAASQPFTLKNRQPEPVILAPLAGQTLAAGQAVGLRGSATDAEDGGLGAAALGWQVDGNSQGSGPDIAAAGLAPGTHIAALSATDSLSQTAVATASFSIAPLSVPLASVPTLDGSCDDAGYGTVSSLALKPYADGTAGSVRLLRGTDSLWACFSGLKLAAPITTSLVGLRADIDNSRDPFAQPSDTGFFVGENGDVSTRAGDGAGGFGAAGPSGLQAQVSAGASSWSAELRIDAAALGGLDHLIGLSVSHEQVAAQSDAYSWPYAAVANKPNTWAATALGNQPLITALEPFSATVGSQALPLTITGSGFVSGTVALWNGTALPTTVVDGEQLTADVSASLLATPALVQVTTRSPAPGSFTSNGAPFVVEALPPAITALSPASIVAGGPAQTLIVSGSNFVSGAQVLWNGQALATQFVSATELRAGVAGPLLASGQVVGITVRNQVPAEQVSSVVPFTVQPQGPPGRLLPVILR